MTTLLYQFSEAVKKHKESYVDYSDKLTKLLVEHNKARERQAHVIGDQILEELYTTVYDQHNQTQAEIRELERLAGQDPSILQREGAKEALLGMRQRALTMQDIMENILSVTLKD